MSTALDFAFARPTISQIKATGATGVIRYISHSASKNITKSELGTYLAAGLPVALVFEDGATRAQQGYGAGASDAGYVLQSLKALGLAQDTPVYYAVDSDTSWSAVKPYFDGARSLHPQASIYGGYNVVLGAWTDHIPYLWQTRAWSNGRILEAACLYQTGTTLGGSADINQIRNHDWGQIPRPEVPMTPNEMQQVANTLLNTGITSQFRKDEHGKPLVIPVRKYFDYLDKHYDDTMTALSALRAEVQTLIKALGK